jgi:Spy/CpxP family protein refolding chaperone
MNRALKWKLIVGFVLVFLAGGMTGVFVGASPTFHSFVGSHHPGFSAERMRARLQWQLRLTDEQLAKISPLIDETVSQLKRIRGDTGRRVRDTFAEFHRQIAPDLTPEQRTKLQKMEERQRRWLHRARGMHEATPEPSASAQ